MCFTQKKTYTWPTATWKVSQRCSVLEKCKWKLQWGTTSQQSGGAALCSVMSDSFVAPWTVAHQAPLYMEFSRQSWSRLPFPTPGDLSNPGIEHVSLAPPALAGRFCTTAPSGKPSHQQKKKTLQTINAVESVEKRDPLLYCRWECKLVQD